MLSVITYLIAPMPYVFFSSGGDNYYSDGGSSLCEPPLPPNPTPASRSPRAGSPSPLPPSLLPLPAWLTRTLVAPLVRAQVGRPRKVHLRRDGDLVGGAARHPPTRAGHHPRHLPALLGRPPHLHSGGHNLPMHELGHYELLLHVNHAEPRAARAGAPKREPGTPTPSPPLPRLRPRVVEGARTGSPGKSPPPPPRAGAARRRPPDRSGSAGPSRLRPR